MRHPAMGFSCGIGGMVPFTMRWGVSFISSAVNKTREAAALPLSIPAAPRGNRCCALRSPPACLPAAGSTRHPVSVRLCPPSMASRPCHSRSGSPISAGTQPHRFDIADESCSVSLIHCRMALTLIRPTVRSGLVGRIRRSRHPAIVPGRQCLMALRLSGLRGFSRTFPVGRISV